jgi:protein-tyrosine phosphatase/arsenate reductase
MKYLVSFLFLNSIVMSLTTQQPLLFPSLQSFFDDAKSNFNQIPVERKMALKEISDYISKKKKDQKEVELTFICTHNSRRSHISQILAQSASVYYGINNIYCYSGGTEVTAFNMNAVNALRKIGFDINTNTVTPNPVYEVRYGLTTPKLIAFSKVYTSMPNPQKDYGAVLTCSQADASCPIVQGADGRFKLPYEDPKLSDGTPLQDQVYAERCRQIGLEMLYMFSLVK